MSDAGAEVGSPAALAAPSEIEFLTKKISTNINNFENSADLNRIWAFWLRIAIASLGSITTVLVGISAIPDFGSDTTKILAIATSAAVPILVGWDAFYDYHWLWIKYTGAYTRLKNVKDKMERIKSTERPMTSAQFESLYPDYRAALDETNGAWLEKRATPPSGTPKSVKVQ